MSDDEREIRPGPGSPGSQPPPPPEAQATPATEGSPAAEPLPTAGPDLAAEPARVPRPLVERVGMALIAAVLATLFAGVGAAAFVSGEPFLGVMAGIGAAMTAWVGALTLVRG